MSHDLLFEIGCEELPASFVEAALAALPKLTTDRLSALRLEHGQVHALGTPRRLTIIVEGLQAQQADLEETVTGPPVKAAFRDGAPTKAAEAFAKKLGCAIDDLQRVDTPKGEYLRGTRHERGKAAKELLPELLALLVSAVPFRKSMRWGAGSLTFGRPVRWLLARLAGDVLPVKIEGIEAGGVSQGHRFLHPQEVTVGSASEYVTALRDAHVYVDPAERAERMQHARPARRQPVPRGLEVAAGQLAVCDLDRQHGPGAIQLEKAGRGVLNHSESEDFELLALPGVDVLLDAEVGPGLLIEEDLAQLGGEGRGARGELIRECVRPVVLDDLAAGSDIDLRQQAGADDADLRPVRLQGAAARSELEIPVEGLTGRLGQAQLGVGRRGGGEEGHPGTRERERDAPTLPTRDLQSPLLPWSSS